MNHNFLELSVWSDAVDHSVNIYKITSQFSEFEKFGLRSQMCRCAVSIPSNIAEGCGRDSSPEFIRFLNIAMGSCYELETQIHIASRVYPNFQSSMMNLIQENRILQRKIGGFKKFIQKSSI